MMKTFSYLLMAITIAASACSSSKKTATVKDKNAFDYEGHRGCRGLLPENTITGMKKAVDLGVTTLELDVVISKDNQVVVSHDPIFVPVITTTPAGKHITRKEAEELVLYKMDYADIRKYDVGLKPHPEFPQQQKISAYKPLLGEMIDSIEQYIKQKGTTVAYNVEIKSREGRDGIDHPDVQTFTEMVMDVLKEKKVMDRLIICSFDVRPLQYLHKHYPAVTLSYLVGKSGDNLDKQLQKLSFTPDRFSPTYSVITKALVDECHQKGMKIIAWTVNNLEDMNNLVAMGVDGLISDYPNLYSQLAVKK
jgi:glycerophosphoryl diester phosphodiesterase